MRSNEVGATLGKDALSTTLKAGAIGMCLVAVIMIALYLLPGVISVFAFAGAILALLLVYSVGMVGSAGSTSRLVLAGMAISVILTAATQFFISIAPDAYTVRNITAWTMGSLSSARWTTIGFPSFGAIAGSLVFIYFGRAFNLLSQGDETATSLGLNVKSIN